MLLSKGIIFRFFSTARASRCLASAIWILMLVGPRSWSKPPPGQVRGASIPDGTEFSPYYLTG